METNYDYEGITKKEHDEITKDKSRPLTEAPIDRLNHDPSFVVGKDKLESRTYRPATEDELEAYRISKAEFDLGSELGKLHHPGMHDPLQGSETFGRVIQSFPEENIYILDGKYGEYVTDGKIRVKLPINPEWENSNRGNSKFGETLTLDDCKILLEKGYLKLEKASSN